MLTQNGAGDTASGQLSFWVLTLMPIVVWRDARFVGCPFLAAHLHTTSARSQGHAVVRPQSGTRTVSYARRHFTAAAVAARPRTCGLALYWK